MATANQATATLTARECHDDNENIRSSRRHVGKEAALAI